MQLTYRGHVYQYSSAMNGNSTIDGSPATVPAVKAGATRTLFYLGNVYQCPCVTLRPTRLAKVINWRFASVA